MRINKARQYGHSLRIVALRLLTGQPSDLGRCPDRRKSAVLDGERLSDGVGTVYGVDLRVVDDKIHVFRHGSLGAGSGTDQTTETCAAGYGEKLAPIERTGPDETSTVQQLYPCANRIARDDALNTTLAERSRRTARSGGRSLPITLLQSPFNQCRKEWHNTLGRGDR